MIRCIHCGDLFHTYTSLKYHSEHVGHSSVSGKVVW